MAAIPVGEAAFAGFEVIRRKPLALLAWAGVFVLYFLLVAAFLSAVFGTAMGLGGEDPDVSSLLAFQATLVGMQFTLTVASFVMRIVLTCAIYRAVLTPADSRFAYLRLGKTELMVGLVALCVGIIAAMLLIACALIGVGIVAAASLISEALAWGLGAVLLVGLGGVSAWVILRLSMALPMTFADGRIRVFEAWELTRGHVWRLFLMMLIVVAVILLIQAVVVAVAAVAVMVVGGAGLALDPYAFETLPAEALRTWFGLFVPIAVLGGLVLAVVAAAVQTLVVAPWAVAWRALTTPTESPA